MEQIDKPGKPKKFNEKVLTALLSLGVALLLWLYVVTIISPNSDNTYKGIPITLQGMVLLQERGLMITTEELPTVELHLEGNRSDLNKLNSSNIFISADVSGIGAPGTYEVRVGNPSYPSDVPNTAITVLSKSPERITIVVEKREETDIPVEIRYLEDEFDATNYMADKENRVLDKSTVRVSGPKSVVDQIAMARIDVDLNGRVESIEQSYTYTLCNAKGEPVDVETIQTDTEAVHLSLKIVRIKKVPLVVKEIIYGGGATANNTKVTIDPGAILVSGNDAMLTELTKIQLESIDLSQIMENTELMLPIILEEGITNETGITEAKVIVEFNGLVTKTLTATNIEIINQPENLIVTPVTMQLDVTLRGPQELLDQILPEQIRVQVDCAHAQPGNQSMKAVILSGVEGVGAVGTNSVTVTVENK